MKPKFEFSSMGENIYIGENVYFRRPHLIHLGSNISIDYGVYMTTAAKIGNYVHIGPYVTCIGGEGGTLEMENFSSIAAGARIVCVSDELKGYGLSGPGLPTEVRDNLVGSKISICRFSAVGTGAILLPDTIVSEGSVIGAGSVISGTTEPWTVYLGNPGRPIKVRERGKLIELAEKLERNH